MTHVADETEKLSKMNNLQLEHTLHKLLAELYVFCTRNSKVPILASVLMPWIYLDEHFLP